MANCTQIPDFRVDLRLSSAIKPKHPSYIRANPNQGMVRYVYRRHVGLSGRLWANNNNSLRMKLKECCEPFLFINLPYGKKVSKEVNQLPLSRCLFLARLAS